MITKPMDLGTIKKRLNERWYSSASQCIADFKQMFENCRAYNINKDDVGYICYMRIFSIQSFSLVFVPLIMPKLSFKARHTANE